ncbi:unnamed protein product [Brassica oleracea var. botrytis]|uniref:Uncharacterized protein n=1 Tax=Brassica oleracea TaxID=3712 RepID=A0A3P6EFT4_BRAOL|nr:unnamed protein product [Brassica oleracea]
MLAVRIVSTENVSPAPSPVEYITFLRLRSLRLKPVMSIQGRPWAKAPKARVLGARGYIYFGAPTIRYDALVYVSIFSLSYTRKLRLLKFIFFGSRFFFLFFFVNKTLSGFMNNVLIFFCSLVTN